MFITARRSAREAPAGARRLRRAMMFFAGQVLETVTQN